MPFQSLAKIAAQLSEADIQRLLVLKRSGPKLEKLEAKRKKIADQLAGIEKEFAALTGGAMPKVPAKRGRRPGRPAKVATAPAKRGRKASMGQTGGATPAKPGKRAVARPKAVKPAKNAKAKQPVANDARRAKLLENLAKARAARAAKRAAAQ